MNFLLMHGTVLVIDVRVPNFLYPLSTSSLHSSFRSFSLLLLLLLLLPPCTLVCTLLFRSLLLHSLLFCSLFVFSLALALALALALSHALALALVLAFVSALDFLPCFPMIRVLVLIVLAPLSCGGAWTWDWM